MHPLLQAVGLHVTGGFVARGLVPGGSVAGGPVNCGSVLGEFVTVVGNEIEERLFAFQWLIMNLKELVGLINQILDFQFVFVFLIRWSKHSSSQGLVS